MNTSQQTGGLRHALRRLRHSERGQGLVEYALIIVVVSLGAIASLTFLRDEIRNLFSRAGSSLALGAGASSGGTSTSTTGGPILCPPSCPAGPVQPVNGSGNPIAGVWYAPASAVNTGGNPPYSGLPGVYTDDSNGAHVVGTTCGPYTLPGGATFTGVWIYHSTGSGGSGDEWVLTESPNVNADYQWACLQVTPPDETDPTPTSLSIANGGTTNNRADSGDVITIVFSEALRVRSMCDRDNDGNPPGWTGDTTNQSFTAGTMTLVDGGGGNDDSVTVSSPNNTCDNGFQFGSIDLNRSDYVSGGSRSFAADVNWNAATFTLTITLTSNGTGGTIGTPTTASVARYSPDSSIEDVAGNNITGTRDSASDIHF